MKQKYVLLVVFFLVKIAFGQTSDPLLFNERIIINTDRNEYAVGENIWFKIYNINENGAFSDLSKIIYVEVISPSGYSISRKKNKLDEGKAYGHLILPDTLTTNIYKVIAYTNWSKNNSINPYFEKSILIYNPDKKGILKLKQKNTKQSNELNASLQIIDSINSSQGENQQSVEKLDSSSYYAENSNSDIDLVRITRVQDIYQTRKKVSINIGIPEISNTKKAYLSLSVKKAPRENSVSCNNTWLTKDLGNSNFEILYQPENKGALISGRILKEDGTLLSNESICLNYPDSIINIQSGKTDSYGNFNFYLDIVNPLMDILVHASNSENKLMIEFDDHFLNDYIQYMPYENDEFNFNEEYLKEIYLNSRISRIFNNNWVKVIENRREVEKSNFYDQADEIYSFDNYYELDSIAEYIYEIIPSVKVIHENGDLSIKVLNPRTYNFYNGSPAIFINGIIYENPKFMLDLDPKTCDRIELVRSPILIKDKIYYGLIGIFTKSANLDGLILQDNSVAIEYQVFNESTLFDFKGGYKLNKPDFRNTLYWNPEIIIKANNEKIIEFYTGDDSSMYEIVVHGLTDGGEEVYSRKVFKVER